MATDAEAAAADNIEKLYKNFGILADAKENIREHDKEYLEILAAVKGTLKEKRLASNFIARFFKDFPNLADQALEAQLDLCEDDDVSIRKQAIKDLSAICKDNKEQVPKVADILAQLLETEDVSEFAMIQESLITLLKFDAKGTLSGIFSQLLTGDESETVRERCIKFLSKKVIPIDRNIIDKTAEDFLIIETKKVLQDVTGDEFIQLIHILSNSRLTQTPLGQKQLVDIIADQAEINHPFDPEDHQQIDRILHCSSCALPFFGFMGSNKFVLFLLNDVLSQLDRIPKEIENIKHVHLELLKIFAECCAHCKPLHNGLETIEKTIELLFRYIIAPPEDEDTETNFEFSHIEAALYALHQLMRICPDLQKADSDLHKTNLFKNLKLRLHNLAGHAQGYIKPLRDNIRGKTKTDAKTDGDGKIKIAALKMTMNISNMIKDIFHNPPRCKAEIPLSWKTPASAEAKKSEELTKKERKRHSSYSQDEIYSKQNRPSGREIYHPPSGKFSQKVSSYGPKSNNWNSNRSRGSSRSFRTGSRWRY